MACCDGSANASQASFLGRLGWLGVRNRVETSVCDDFLRFSVQKAGGDADEGLALVIQTLLAQAPLEAASRSQCEACGGAAEQLEQMFGARKRCVSGRFQPFEALFRGVSLEVQLRTAAVGEGPPAALALGGRHALRRGGAAPPAVAPFAAAHAAAEPLEALGEGGLFGGRGAGPRGPRGGSCHGAAAPFGPLNQVERGSARWRRCARAYRASVGLLRLWMPFSSPCWLEGVGG